MSKTLLQASNGQWVAAELGITNAPLIANRAVPSSWETFNMINAGSPTGPLRTQHQSSPAGGEQLIRVCREWWWTGSCSK